jgi:hypothetical protein
MKTIWKAWVAALFLAWATASAQVIMERPKVVKVRVEDVPLSTAQIFSPVPGKVYSDTLIRVEGVVLNPRPRAKVWLRLNEVEREVSLDAKGRFSTVLPLSREGASQLIVDTGGIPQKVEVRYRPALSSLSISPPASYRGALSPGETLPLETIARLKTGEVRRVTPETVWKCDSGAGRVEAGGRFVALQPGRAVVSAVYGDLTATIPILVDAPEPPPPSPGLTNLTVNTPHVVLNIWDHKAEDGDIVTAFLNGAPVASHLTIFNHPQAFRLTLRPGSNLIEILAENEGTQPPNTAAISVAPEGGQGDVQSYKAYQKTKSHFTVTLR